ncbi:unnamed protein product [Withania somnifera]
MIRPSTPTPKNLRSLKLSFFDQGAPRICVPIMFHYLPSSECNREGIIKNCDKLQKSLAETLTNFYPLAGRFREDEFSIHCNDEGVEYVESKVNTDLADFLREGPKIEPLDDLLPQMDQPSSPLLGVQVNVFNSDAFTLATFINEWAQTCRTGTTTEGCLPSFGQLSSIFPAKALSGPQFSPPSNRGPKIITKRFVFDALAIAKLKERINSSATFMRPTRVVVVMSLIWKVLLRISLAKYGHSRDSSFLFPINLRGRSNLASLEHAQGNFYVTVAATLEAIELRRELNDFVNSIGSTAGDTSLSIGKASVDEIISLSIKWGTEIINKLGQGDEMDIYASTSWCRFPWYEADFGWGKPIWVSSVGRTFEVICLFDTKNSEGIEAWVSLKENEMIGFEKNRDILSSTSKVAFDSSIWIK